MNINAKSLEKMISEITSPLATHTDPIGLSNLYSRITNDAHGPEVALRLLAHKIQSPQQEEALCALAILELCVQNCGSCFHRELGKFKFLNEMIKVLLPNHLGKFTPPAVRNKCILLMFTWQRDLSDKYPKLRDAYQALKAQNVVTVDPVVPNETEIDTQYMKQVVNRFDIFQSSHYKDKLTQLLKSKKPEDLRQANAMIKNIVLEEDSRLEKRSKCLAQLETLRNNTNLLEEMLRCLNPNERPPASDADVMEEIATTVRQSRPTIFKFASTDEADNQEFLAEVIEVCSRASSILERYEVVVLHKPPSILNDPAAASIQHRTPSPPPTASALSMSDDPLILMPETHHQPLCQDLLNLEINDIPTPLPAQLAQTASNVKLLDGLLIGSADVLPSDQVNGRATLISPSRPLSSNSVAGMASSSKTSPKSTPASSVAAVFSDLDTLGLPTLGLSTVHSNSTTVATFSSSTSLDSLMHLKEVSTKEPDYFQKPQPPSTTPDIANLIPLASLQEMTLAAILPHPQYTLPILVFPTDNTEENVHSKVKVVLHCSANRPHPSVAVLVATITNRASLPLTNLLLRFGVKKPLKVRQLRLSTSNLPAICSLSPPSPAQQIVYIQQPPPFAVKTATLNFQLSFTMDEEDFLESGALSVPLD